MRLFLLTTCALTALCGSASGSESRAVVVCASAQLHMRVQVQGESTTTWIGVLIRNRRTECLVAGNLTIVSSGRMRTIAGTPLYVRVRGLLGADGSRLVRADWSNWCGRSFGLELVADFVGLRTRSAIRSLPGLPPPKCALAAGRDEVADAQASHSTLPGAIFPTTAKQSRAS
jgi:hypothetical protein